MRHITHFAAIAILALSATLFADGLFQIPPDAVKSNAPQSLAARDALVRFDGAKKKAQAEYDQAMRAASAQAIQELTAAKAAVMKTANLDEANRIQAAIEEVKASDNSAIRLILDSRANWVNVVAVKAGERIDITSSGKWCADVKLASIYTFNPAGTAQAKWFGLVARIGNGPATHIGEKGYIVAQSDGQLSVKMLGGDPRNNAGSVNVTVTRPAP